MEPQHRLRAAKDFERARKQGRSWGSALLVLHAVHLPLPHQATRCGFSVSRRVGGAVVRNRVRRRLRDIVRRRMSVLPAGWLLVITARPPAAKAPTTELTLALDGLLQRAGLRSRAHQDLRASATAPHDARTSGDSPDPGRPVDVAISPSRERT
ncbi:MAG: ribonuclease P protein component [Chloroflexota bacterium]|nr:ribonuclease P protein component [Chloroflexota bacterium]